MDDESQEEEATQLFSRHRSRSHNFKQEEIKTLVNIVQKFKNVILNKSTNSAACQAKELAWIKIAKLYNSSGFKHKKSSESLKGKWDNLKKVVRRISKNVMDIDQEDFDEVTSQVFAIIKDSDNSNEVSLPEDLNEEIKGAEEAKDSKGACGKYWDDSDDKDAATKSDEEEVPIRFKVRSMKFTPQECSALLKCVRLEKKYVFCTDTSSKAIRNKNRAWSRITQYFNNISPQKRSTKMLRSKFSTIRHLANRKAKNLFGKDSSKKYMKMEINVGSQKIKSEPRGAFDTDNERDEDSGHNDDDTDNNFDGLMDNGSSNHVDIAPDPLTVVLNSGDSGMDSLNVESYSESKEIVKLKTQLLQYQLETAKLERRRIEAAMQAEAEANQARATEGALRIRAARLEAIAAAMKLPQGHPALNFTPEEATAHNCLGQYQT